MPDGRLCRASAIRGEPFCYMHDPSRAEEADEARRLGRARRRREGTLGGAYELDGVRTVDDLWRLVEITVFDLLALDNSVPRDRALLQAAQVGTRLHEAQDLGARVVALEAALRTRSADAGPNLDLGDVA